MKTFCDNGCKTEITRYNRRHVLVSLTSSRVNMRRIWVFCGADCRAEWWSSFDAEPLAAVTKDPENRDPTLLHDHEVHRDQGFLVQVFHQQGHDVLFQHVETTAHTAPDDVNNWWQDPAVAATVIADADLSQASSQVPPSLPPETPQKEDVDELRSEDPHS